MLKLIPVVALALAAHTPFARAQGVVSSCQGGALVERGDTLSSISERCDVSEARLLAANPGVEGSSDLVVGQRVSTGSEATQTGNRLWSDFKGAVGETTSALEGVAKGINSSAQDILDKNPDLRSRIDSLGSKLNIPGSGPSANVSVEGLPGTPEDDVAITATGLSSNQAVGINVAAAGSASERVAQAQTSTDGTLTETVRLPDWLTIGKPVVVTITDERQDVIARSSRFVRN